MVQCRETRGRGTVVSVCLVPVVAKEFSQGLQAKNKKKYDRLLGADRRYSLRIRVIKRRGKTKREKAFSQGSCGKMQGGNFENKLEFVSGNADADRNADKEHTRLATPSPP